MISQQTNYANTSQADYSAVQRKVAHENMEKNRGQNQGQNQGFNIADDRVSLSSPNEYGSVGNQNLSSVLSQIQDDGPAYADSKKRDNLINLRTNKNNRYSTDPQTGSENQADVQSDLAAELLRKINANADIPASDIKYTAWLQLLLIAFIIAVTIFYLFSLDVRTNQLEESLNLRQVKLQDSMASHRNALSPDVASFNEALQAVKKELELIKTNNDVSDSGKDLPVIDKTLQLKEAAPENVSVLKDEILLLKNELKSANNKLVAINKNLVEKSSPAEKTVANKIIVGSGPAGSGWIVNLASFTNKGGAEKTVEQLISSGFSPLIELAMVNGTQVYRLIVDGFEDRSEAELFIATTAESFGLKAGWIRKN